MASLKVQGTTGTPPMSNGKGSMAVDASTAAAVGRAKLIAAGLFVVLIILHTKGKE